MQDCSRRSAAAAVPLAMAAAILTLLAAAARGSAAASGQQRDASVATLVSSDPLWRPTCASAKNRCVHRQGCGMALHNVMLSCAEEMRPPSAAAAAAVPAAASCAARCRRALVSLMSVDEGLGSDYLSCDCAGNVNCELLRTRLGVCSAGVSGSLRRLRLGPAAAALEAAPAGAAAAATTEQAAAAVSCSLAKLLCEADTSCGTALHFFEVNCRSLWMTPAAAAAAADTNRCSRKCNNSLAVLYRQQRAGPLRTCVCDASDGGSLSADACVRMRTSTERHCLQRDLAASQRYHYDGALDEGGGGDRAAPEPGPNDPAGFFGGGRRKNLDSDPADVSLSGGVSQGQRGATNYGLATCVAAAAAAAVVARLALPCGS